LKEVGKCSHALELRLFCDFIFGEILDLHAFVLSVHQDINYNGFVIKVKPLFPVQYIHKLSLSKNAKN
jgi:hypothetical protein